MKLLPSRINDYYPMNGTTVFVSRPTFRCNINVIRHVRNPFDNWHIVNPQSRIELTSLSLSERVSSSVVSKRDDLRGTFKCFLICFYAVIRDRMNQWIKLLGMNVILSIDVLSCIREKETSVYQDWLFSLTI